MQKFETWLCNISATFAQFLKILTIVQRQGDPPSVSVVGTIISFCTMVEKKVLMEMFLTELPV